MKLSLIDRVIILKSILPQSGTMEQIKNMISIKSKIALTNLETSSLKILEPYNNMIEIENITEEMLIRSTDYKFELIELEDLKKYCSNMNSNGWVTESSLDTIEYIINYTIEE